MAKKTGNQNRQGKKKLGSIRWIVLTVILVVVIVFGLVLASTFLQSEARFPLTAAIIDQLGTDFPDAPFVSNVTGTLRNHGFDVDYYNKSLNVDFFRNLASSNYGIIILRVHSALRNDSSTVDLFTSEEYVEGVHQQELNDGLLAVGQFYYKPDQYYYALSSLFIANLQGRFPSSIVIAMGCQGLKPTCEQLAEAFVAKGAKAYVGWSDIVFPNDTDTETMDMLNMLLNENRTIGDAVGSTSPHTYTGYVSSTNRTVVTVKSRMDLYPMTNENLTISQLTAQSKVSSASSLSEILGFPFFWTALKKPRNWRRRKSGLAGETSKGSLD